MFILNKVNALAMGLVLAGSTLWAQDNTIFLKSYDNNFVISGELLDFDGVFYHLRTSMGELSIDFLTVECTGNACPPKLVAEDDQSVILTAPDGIQYGGILVSYNGINYTIESELGTLIIKSDRVQCTGQACPDPEQGVAVFRIAAPAGVGALFLESALQKFTELNTFTIKDTHSHDDHAINYAEIEYHINDQLDNPIAQVTVMPANDAQSIQALFSGDATFALTREAFSAEKIAAITNMAVNDVATRLDSRVIALDALVAHLHVSNPVRSVSLEQMADIMAGNITNWSEIGGKDLEITFYFLDENSSLAQIVQRDVLGPRGLELASSTILFDTRDEMNKTIANDASGFTLSFRSDSHHGMQNAALERYIESSAGGALRFDELNAAADGHGIRIPSTRNSCNLFASANAFSMQTEEYPLTMRWHIYSLKQAESPSFATQFANFLSSDEGQTAAEAAGLVGVAITVQPIRNQGERLLSALISDRLSRAEIRTYQQYLAEVSTGYRLSATMRFKTGTSRLDERSKQDWARISDLISSGMMVGNDLILVGFSDSVGNFNGNINLSRSRAAYLKTVVLEENPDTLTADDIQTFGFGSVAPVGCNDTAQGRTLNRRVEVWIRGENALPLQ